MQNNSIKFHGLEKEIMKAKLEINNLITEKNKNWLKKREEDMQAVYLSKNIQWKYEISTGKWAEFSIETNSQIEVAYSQKAPKVRNKLQLRN